MSGLSLRRFRAERLLAQEFEALRSKVLATVRRRLTAAGAEPEGTDLEACYAQAWQGLYAAVVEGQEITNPAGWLVVVTQRRAIEEHRVAHNSELVDPMRLEERALEPDMAARIDDLSRLRHLFEAMSARLSGRECEAASLCYLQGLSRAEAASRMGLSEQRMRKLMDGDGARREGVARKVARLLEVVGEGGWCEEQGSLMRALAFGILDPEGERYGLAVRHQRECAACRHYVRRLRGLAAVLPPVLAPPGVLAPFGVGVRAVPGTRVGAKMRVGAGARAAGRASATGGSAGGGWGAAGSSLGGKLAAALAAVGVGACGVALVPGGVRSGGALHARAAARPRFTVLGERGIAARQGDDPAASARARRDPRRPVSREWREVHGRAVHTADALAHRGGPDGGEGEAAEFGIEREALAGAAGASSGRGGAQVPAADEAGVAKGEFTFE